MDIQSFDTHAFVKQLIEAGIPVAQAEAIASLKLDIVRLSNRMEERFAEVDRRFDAQDIKLEAMKADMIKWMFGFFATNLAATFTMIRYLA
jgi:hypothetical protein